MSLKGKAAAIGIGELKPVKEPGDLTALAEATWVDGSSVSFVDGEDPLKEVTMAKLLTQRACFELMDACLQIHGGAGYMREYWVERAARDARLGPIGGGSDEIMREILGRVLAL